MPVKKQLDGIKYFVGFIAMRVVSGLGAHHECDAWRKWRLNVQYEHVVLGAGQVFVSISQSRRGLGTITWKTVTA